MSEGGVGRQVEVVAPAVADQVRLSAHRQRVVVDLIDVRTDCSVARYLLQVVDLIVAHTSQGDSDCVMMTYECLTNCSSLAVPVELLQALPGLPP